MVQHHKPALCWYSADNALVGTPFSFTSSCPNAWLHMETSLISGCAVECISHVQTTISTLYPNKPTMWYYMDTARKKLSLSYQARCICAMGNAAAASDSAAGKSGMIISMEHWQGCRNDAGFAVPVLMS